MTVTLPSTMRVSVINDSTFSQTVTSSSTINQSVITASKMTTTRELDSPIDLEIL